MTETQFFATPGYGPFMLENRHYQQAVRIGDRVDISGKGGWDDDLTFPESLEEEIVWAFDNVERTLATAEATWRDVVSVDSFHIPDAPDSSATHTASSWSSSSASGWVTGRPSGP